MEIVITLNGKKTKLPRSLNLCELLLALAISNHGVVIEKNRTIILAKDFINTFVEEHDEIEILTMVDGG
ncbi:MAG: sulfur carrier protein ThiS [Oligoflexia bacterium]|nr:sulfur carrier protein ThiS [Oligoflexia bacterium]MBF0364351.1 sulfur carrier protein ThiS [Oligoflexia bacterium]